MTIISIFSTNNDEKDIKRVLLILTLIVNLTRCRKDSARKNDESIEKEFANRWLLITCHIITRRRKTTTEKGLVRALYTCIQTSSSEQVRCVENSPPVGWVPLCWKKGSQGGEEGGRKELKIASRKCNVTSWKANKASQLRNCVCNFPPSVCVSGKLHIRVNLQFLRSN